MRDPRKSDACVRNVVRAVAQASQLSFAIEPFNPHDLPGQFLNDFDPAEDLLAEIGAPNLHLRCDAWPAHAGVPRHIQIATTPDRLEPDHGTTDSAALYAAIDASGCTGHIAAEHHPRGQTEASPGWCHAQSV